MAVTSTDTTLLAIHQKLREVASRVRRFGALRGIGVAGLAWLATLAVFGAIAVLWQWPAHVRGALLAVHLAATVAALWWGLGRFDFFRRGVKAWAVYCERRHPRLEDRLATVIDVTSDPHGKPHPVTNLLIDETDRKLKLFRLDQIASDDVIKGYALLATSPLVFALLAWLAFPGPSTAAFQSLYGIPASTDPAYSLQAFRAKQLGLEVKPGNIEIARGSKLDVLATTDAEPEDGVAPEVTLTGKNVTGAHGMIVGDNPREFALRIDRVDAPLKYQVVLAGVVSPRYTVDVYDAPEIESIATRIDPPAYLAQAASEVDSSYISAPAGSALNITVTATARLETGLLIDETGEKIGGKVDGTRATFNLTADEDRRYEVVIHDTAGHPNIDPPTLEIHAVPDEAPSIRLARPGADWAIHPIGEVDVEVEIADDHGVKEAVLEYRINDDEPVTVALLAKGEMRTETFTAAHRFELERMDVAVGDVILYRVIAFDARPDRAAARSVSQPYFVTIRPYEQRFFRGNPGGEGESSPSPPNQRDVIVATMRLMDKVDAGESDTIASDANEVAESQAQVLTATVRARSGMAARGDLPDRAERVAHLDQAMEAMQTAEQLLRDAQLSEALPPENAALSHVIAAFAGLPKSDSQGGGGGAPPPELLGQKLESEREKYEQMDALAREIDRALQEAINRTKALAQRQKEFAETIRREREEASQGGGGGGGGSPSQSSASNGRPSNSQSPTSEMLNREEMLAALEEAQAQLEKLQDELLDLEGMQAEMTPDLRQAMRSAADELRRLENDARNEKWDEAQGANARVTEEYRAMIDAMEAMRDQLANAGAPPNEDADLRQALEQVRQMQAQLREQAQQQANAQSPAQGAQGQPSPSSQGAPADSETVGASGGAGGVSQRPGGPRDERGSEAYFQQGSATPTSMRDPRALQVQLETIAYLLDDASPAHPLIESLQSIVASEMRAAPTLGERGETNFAGDMEAILGRIEEILHWELAAEAEMQRLQQTPQEDLPPRFRDLAARYFEALGAFKARTEAAP